MMSVLFVASVVILISQGSTQGPVTCYTSANCQGDGGEIVASAEECCVRGDGIAFLGEGNNCLECVVFGWQMMTANGFRIRNGFGAREQADSFLLHVGFIKGSRFNATQLQFNVTDIPQTADTDDYIINNSVILSTSLQPSLNLRVEFMLVEDEIAMEHPETFLLQLVPQSAEEMLTNEFLADTVEITIMDSDRVNFQFSSSNYMAMEGSNLPIVIQRFGQIATAVTLRVATMNLTELDNLGLPSPPDIPPFDPDQPNIASSGMDFRSDPIDVTFEPDEHLNSTIQVNIPTTEDNVNEADQYFVVLLELVFAVNQDMVDINTAGNISTCKIIDDDPIRIAFARSNYKLDEADPNAVKLERTLSSEQTFTIRIRTGSVCNNKNTMTAQPNGVDYGVEEGVFLFRPNVTNAVVPISINDDIIWETEEDFDICISRSSSSAHFTSNKNERNAEVTIEDNDFVIVGFEETEYTMLASEEIVDVRVVISQGDVEPCIQLVLQTDIPGTEVYPLTICDLNAVSVKVNLSSAGQLRETFQADLSLNVSSNEPIPQEMAARLVILPNVSTINVVESLTESSSSVDVSFLAWGVPVCVMLLLVLGVIIGAYILRRRRHNKKKAQSNEIRREDSEPAYWMATGGGERLLHQVGGNHNNYTKLMSLQLQLPKRMSISSRQLKLLDIIGEGEFGMVYNARLQSENGTEQVAVKTLKGIFTPNDVRNMLKEVEKMQDLDHRNVMSLKGVCLDGGSGPAIVMPYMERGSLLDHLRKERKQLIVPHTDESNKKHLLEMCLQISQGMRYLAAQKIVHRDLAARNCMVDADGVVKVADFGLSEDIYTQNYCRLDKSDKGVKLPLRWMAPESIEDWVFSEKSDVWSYGVTMWEIYTGGTVPYGGIGAMAILRLLKNKERLTKPTNAACDDEIYSVMLDCWKGDPKERPDFSELFITISTQLEAIAGYLSLSVSQCSSNHSLDDLESTSRNSVKIEMEQNNW